MQRRNALHKQMKYNRYPQPKNNLDHLAKLHMTLKNSHASLSMAKEFQIYFDNYRRLDQVSIPFSSDTFIHD